MSAPDARRSGSPRWLAASCIAAVALATVVACTSGTSSPPTTVAAGPAPSSANARGAQLYAEKCASCHGGDLRGTDKGPSHLSRVYEPGHHGDAAFRAAIANGSRQHHWKFGDMPPVPGMSDADVAAVIAYVREVQQREGFEG